jgi:HEAT repeat protein
MMRFAVLILTVISFSLHAEDTPVSRMLDDKLTVAQRNDACFELRVVHSTVVTTALKLALAEPVVRSCAARNLRESGAVDELKAALADNDPEIRAVAARELGMLARPELVEPLAQMARDPNLLVAINSLEALAQYQDRSALPYLLSLAESGGLVGAMALSRAVQFQEPAVLAVARQLMKARDVPLRLAALRAIGDLGDASDLPGLKELAAKAESATSTGRGFGLVPALDLSRAAQNALRQIERRK